MLTTAENQNTIEFLLDVPVKLTVELGNCEMTMKDLLQLGIGAVVQLDKLADDPIDIFVNQKLVARGEIVVVEENLGIKITEVSTGSGQVAEESPAPDTAEKVT
jgi:flagellar motor switch protein FliN/FliY